MRRLNILDGTVPEERLGFDFPCVVSGGITLFVCWACVCVCVFVFDLCYSGTDSHSLTFRLHSNEQPNMNFI